MVVIDVGATKQLGRVHLAFAKLAGIFGGDDRKHARRLTRLGQVDGFDAALGDGRADEVTISLAWNHIVTFVGIGRGARRLGAPVDAIVRLAHDLHLVDRILSCGSVELHVFLASAMTAPSGRSTSSALNALSGLGFAPANKREAVTFAPCGTAASAASTRHGLCAIPPTAMRPVPSLWITAATETSAKAYDARSRTL